MAAMPRPDERSDARERALYLLYEAYSKGISPADALALPLVVVTVSYLSLVVGELVPKSLALRSAEPNALLISRPLFWLGKLARPLVWLLTASSNVVLRLFETEGRRGQAAVHLPAAAKRAVEANHIEQQLPPAGDWSIKEDVLTVTMDPHKIRTFLLTF